MARGAAAAAYRRAGPGQRAAAPLFGGSWSCHLRGARSPALRGVLVGNQVKADLPRDALQTRRGLVPLAGDPILVGVQPVRVSRISSQDRSQDRLSVGLGNEVRAVEGVTLRYTGAGRTQVRSDPERPAFSRSGERGDTGAQACYWQHGSSERPPAPATRQQAII